MKFVNALLVTTASVFSISAFANSEAPLAAESEAPQIVVQDIATPEQLPVETTQTEPVATESNTAAADAQADQTESNAASTEDAKEAQTQK